MEVIFIILSFFAIASALSMIYAKEPMTSALSFIVTLLALAGLFALFSASFLFLVQIIVYAGAIITLMLLIIMFLNIKEDSLPKEPYKLRNMFISALFILPVDVAVIKAVLTLPKKDMSVLADGFGGVKALGMILYKEWLLPFELISILLIVSLIGAIVFAKRKI
jgi:NADH-quinone oxidoreductase subunit J